MDASRARALLDKRTSVNSETGCWEFQGTNVDGYGQITIDGKFYYTHRLSAWIFLGYLLDSVGLEICHKLECRSKACWNPDHIYIGTSADNNRDLMISGNARGGFSGVTHCVNGHELTPSNTYTSYRGKHTSARRRSCRICRKERAKKGNKK